jgi:hypothetical protein
MSLTDKQKRIIRQQAGDCCEYCLLAQGGRLARFHVDHVVAVAHGGADTEDNLCLACPKCNAYKSVNVAALDPATGDASKLYNPRQQSWDDHFLLNDDATITGRTPEVRTTVAVLRMNDSERVQQRLGEMLIGDYPCEKNDYVEVDS